jgi:membrane protein DedA with SNARE-associated domain
VGGAVFSNGSVTFSITHLSYYLVGEEVVSESIEPNQYLMIIVVVVIAAVILLGTALFVKKKRAI